MAEDYAAFDVDVTTQVPGAAAIDRADLADRTSARGRASPATPASSAMCSRGCGGIAYIGVFDAVGTTTTTTSRPGCSSTGWRNDTKSMAEAASHEVGHNLASTTTATRTSAEPTTTGHGMWAPIMGVGYNRPITQWSKGEYTDANNPPGRPGRHPGQRASLLSPTTTAPPTAAPPT